MGIEIQFHSHILKQKNQDSLMGQSVWELTVGNKAYLALGVCSGECIESLFEIWQKPPFFQCPRRKDRNCNTLVTINRPCP